MSSEGGSIKVPRNGGATGSTGGTTAPWGNLLNKGSETGAAPKAYLNYLIFDKDYELISGGFVRMTTAGREYGQDGLHEKLAAEFVITEPGYVYIYLSNDNVALGGPQVEVYFDDFNVTQVKSSVVSVQDYYPFRLTFNSYQHQLLSIRHYFNYLLKAEKVKSNPAQGIYVPGIARRLPHDLAEYDELVKLYEGYPVKDVRDQRNKVILGLLIFQALTIEELEALKSKHINLQEGKIRIIGTDRTNERILKLSKPGV